MLARREARSTVPPKSPLPPPRPARSMADPRERGENARIQDPRIQDNRRRRHADPRGYRGRGAAGADGARLPGELVFVAPPDRLHRRGRLHRGGDRRARPMAARTSRARWGRGLFDGGPDGGRGRRRQGAAAGRAGDPDRPRLGRAHRLEFVPQPARGVPGDRRAVGGLFRRAEPAVHRHLPRGLHRQGPVLLPGLVPGRRAAGSRGGGGRARLPAQVLLLGQRRTSRGARAR